MGSQIRALACLLVALAFWQPGVSSQSQGVLRITVVLPDAQGTATPVPNYVLLVSDNPATALPRRVVTSREGTATVRLRPGVYTVESDRPVAFGAKSYQWTEFIEVGETTDVTLELTAANAEVSGVTVGAVSADAVPLEHDPNFLLSKWQGSVVAIWTPTSRASGFLIDARGLIVTNERAIGSATAAEVQMSPAVKVGATVLVSDLVRDVAVLRVDPSAVTGVEPLSAGCDRETRPPLALDQEIYAIGYPLRDPKTLLSGALVRVDAEALRADVYLSRPATGGPAFSTTGTLIGLTSPLTDTDARRDEESRIVSIAAICAGAGLAERRFTTAVPPAATRLPVEPSPSVPASRLEDIVARRAGAVGAYVMTSSEFDIALITPHMVHASQRQDRNGSDRGGEFRQLAEQPPGLRALKEFANWSEYAEGVPPVLLVRITPKLTESFWTTLARGAARTQGMALPPIKRFRAGFARLSAFCGEAEVTPVHPFRIEQRVGDGEAIYEGLYAFDPGALGPQCGSVKFVLFSEKQPDKGDPRIVEPKIVQQVFDDFALYRAGN